MYLGTYFKREDPKSHGNNIANKKSTIVYMIIFKTEVMGERRKLTFAPSGFFVGSIVKNVAY